MAHTIAVDCGGSTLRVARAVGTSLESVRSAPGPARLEDLPDAIVAMADAAGATAVGVAVAGLVDAPHGVLHWMPHRPGGPVDLTRVGTALGIPVVIDNDANMAAYAEALAGAGAGYRMVLMVAVGTGIGGGLVIDGRVERGRGHLGEIGHLQIAPGAPPCPCGLTACWESAASGRALDRAADGVVRADPRGVLAAATTGRRASGRDLVAAAVAGDPGSAHALSLVAEALGEGLANLTAVFDPDVVVVGGGVGMIGEPLLAPARRVMEERRSGGRHRQPTPVVAARFGGDCALVGAALAAAG